MNLDVEGAVATITLNRPARHNALRRSDIEQFIGHLDDITQDASIRVMVLTGSGDATFCSGLELAELAGGNIDIDLFGEITGRLASVPIPKIAALNGNIFGGGVELALSCDFRFGVDGMTLMVPAARLGICYPPEGIARFVSRLGVGPAKRLLVASENLQAEELLRMGYLHHLGPRQGLMERANRLAEHIAGLAPLAVRGMLSICDQIAAGTLDEDDANAWVERCAGSQDLRAGLDAAVRRERAEFKGS